MVTNDTVKQSCFTSAIGTYQADDFSLIDIEGDVVIGDHPTEVLDEIDDLEKRHATYLSFAPVQ
jgi:uncharacterized protein YuzB (UPF0349 family)